MTRKKLGKSMASPTTTRVVILGGPLHSELSKGIGLRDSEEHNSAATEARANPEKYLTNAIMKITCPATRTEGVLMLSDAIDAGADISDAIPIVTELLPVMEPIAQDLAVSVMLYHYFQKQSDSEILSFLRHENPKFARNTVNYMSVRAMSGLDVSLFVPELIKMIYHKNDSVARSAYSAVEAAAILSGDETAVLYLKAVYSQDGGES